MCGVFAVTNSDHASKLAYLGLFALQHRGQESAGISTSFENDILTHHNTGLVSDVFKEENLNQLKGNNAIGHVRYSTAGGNKSANRQPIQARIGTTPVSIAHNGNVVNASIIRKELENSGAILQSTADTEIILHLIARSKKNLFSEKLKDAMSQLIGAFSFVLLTPTYLYAAVDSQGYRPLSIGKMSTNSTIPSFIIASETCALDLVDAKFIRDISPGELLEIDLLNGEIKSDSFELVKNRNQTHSKCIFEHVYFSRPDSLVWGKLTHNTRFDMGAELAKNNPVNADMVIAIPDSGVPMAMGYAQVSQIPYQIGLIRNHYVGRTFIEPTQNVRNFKVRLKLNPVKELVAGKKLIVIDDSLVRGTTSQKIIELLRDAGAKEVHMRIASPPVKFPCFYGIDTPKRKDLLADKYTIQDMNTYLKSDSLAFLSEEQLLYVMNKNLIANEIKNSWCSACFSGKYQDNISQQLGNKEFLEKSTS